MQPKKSFITTIIARYSETDSMSYVHHSNYLKYYEIGRLGWLKSLGFSYRKLEKEDFILPVIRANTIFRKPAFFEDTINVISTIKELSKVKINFSQKIFRENELLLNANVLVIPIDTYGKIVKLPDELISFLEKLN